jgi:hypothetical protein
MDYEKIQAEYREFRKKKYDTMTLQEQKKYKIDLIKYLSSIARKASSPHSVTSL